MPGPRRPVGKKPRTGGTSGRNASGVNQRVKTARGRRLSSTRWLERQLNDPYVSRAKLEGYRSRSAFKLAEIDDEFGFLKPGGRIVDLGAAPGGWSQIAARRTNAESGEGKVVAIDMHGIEAIAGVNIFKQDFLEEGAADALIEALGGDKADAVVSDMAAHATGHRQTDHFKIMALADAGLVFARKVLKPGGTYVCKVLRGGAESELLTSLKKEFKNVRHFKPESSREDSAELFLVATGYRGQA
jgi:23S rRNA (uridine2552-2'-O)-methyltransferase